MRRITRSLWLALPVLALWSGSAFAHGVGLHLNPTPSSLSLLFLMTGMALLPILVMTLTAFPRIIIVLSLLRNAMGLQTTPPTPILVGLALVLTLFIMEPTGSAIYQIAVKPYEAGHLSFTQAISHGTGPLHHFMMSQTSQSNLAFFYKLAHQHPPHQSHRVALWILMPAFVVSQLQTAFEMSVFLYLPFLIVDLVVSTVLMAMGMIMVPPTIISLPLKLLLFVLANGWVLVIKSLVTSFH